MITEAEIKNDSNELLGYIKLDIANVKEDVKNNLPKLVNILDFNFIAPEQYKDEEHNHEENAKIRAKQHEVERLILKKEHSLIDVVKTLNSIKVKLFIDKKEYSAS